MTDTISNEYDKEMMAASFVGHVGLLQSAINDCKEQIASVFAEAVLGYVEKYPFPFSTGVKGGDKVAQGKINDAEFTYANVAGGKIEFDDGHRCMNITDPKPAHEFKTGDLVWLKDEGRMARLGEPMHDEHNGWEFRPAVEIKYGATLRTIYRSAQEDLWPVRVGDKVSLDPGKYPTVTECIGTIRRIAHAATVTVVEVVWNNGYNSRSIEDYRLVELAPEPTEKKKPSQEVIDPESEVKDSAEKKSCGSCMHVDVGLNTPPCRNCRGKSDWKSRKKAPIVSANALARRQRERARRADMFCAHKDCHKLAVVGQCACYEHLPTSIPKIMPPLFTCSCGQELHRTPDGLLALSQCPDCAGMMDGADVVLMERHKEGQRDAEEPEFPVLRFALPHSPNPMVGTFGSGSNLF